MKWAQIYDALHLIPPRPPSLASSLHLLKSRLFQQQHHARLCTGVRGRTGVNAPLESSTQYLLPWSNKWGSATGVAAGSLCGWMDGGWGGGGRRRVDSSVGGGRLATHEEVGVMSKQLEHMAGCQQLPGPGACCSSQLPLQICLFVLLSSGSAEGK